MHPLRSQVQTMLALTLSSRWVSLRDTVQAFNFDSTACAFERHALTPSTRCSLWLSCRRLMTITHNMSLLSIEEKDREAASKMEEARVLEEEAERPRAASMAADKLYVEERQRAAATGQPLNVELYAPQLYNSGCVLEH